MAPRIVDFAIRSAQIFLAKRFISSENCLNQTTFEGLSFFHREER